MLKLLKKLTAKEWGLAGCSLIFIVAQVWLDLTMPDYMSSITQLVQTEGSAMADILSEGAMMLLCALGSLVSSIIVAGFAARIASGFSSRLRSEQFNRVLDFSSKEINEFSTASLITRATNDVTQVQMLIVMGLQVILKAPILAVWALLKISGKSWQWSLSTAAAVCVLVLVVGTCIALTMPRFKKLQELTDDLNRVTRENLTGLRVVRAYNAESYQEKKFEKANASLTNTNLFTGRTMAFLNPSISAIMSGLTLSIYLIGASLINAAAMPDKLTLFSDMVVFSSYAMQVVMAFMMLVMVFILLPRASVSAKRISQVIDTESSVKDGGRTEGLNGLRGEVEFKNVSFKYPDAEEYVIKDISFTAHAGETVAFIGSTGCGKSTVVNLIPRFYDATEGSVLVDGVDVRDYTQKSLRGKLGYVSQNAILFGGTISSNVAYGEGGKSAPDSGDIVDALHIAQATEFVENVDGKYDGVVAQGGANFSGGQKQRISIARAICRAPEVLIFDDSFSALDYRTDRALRSALAKETAGTTCLIVAQRIGTIRDADRIIVLENGGIVGSGTHEELMSSCPVYQEIALSQLSKEELA